MTEKQVTLIVRPFPESLRRSLKMKAAERGISMAALIVAILDEWVRKLT